MNIGLIVQLVWSNIWDGTLVEAVLRLWYGILCGRADADNDLNLNTQAHLQAQLNFENWPKTLSNISISRTTRSHGSLPTLQKNRSTSNSNANLSLPNSTFGSHSNSSRSDLNKFTTTHTSKLLLLVIESNRYNANVQLAAMLKMLTC